jgi:hypothetical protein
MLLDPLEQAGVALLDPLEEERRVAGEDEVGVLVEPVDRGLEGRAHLLVALRPLPQPHRVDVGVADHVQRAAHAPAAHLSTASITQWRKKTCSSWILAVDSDGTSSA